MGSARRTALVSGGNRGIGLEVCRQLASRGHRVLLGARDPAKGKAAAAALRGRGLDATAVALDVADPAGVAALVAAHRAVDILVNNAGVHLDDGASPLRLGEEALRATLDTNLIGAIHLAQALLPGMAERGWGRVANVSSGMGQLDGMGGGSLAYRISKAGLNVATRVLAREVDPARVKVNAACPGWVRTDIGGPGATRGVERVAETIVWLATLPDDGPSGGFFRDKLPIPW